MTSIYEAIYLCSFDEDRTSRCHLKTLPALSFTNTKYVGLTVVTGYPNALGVSSDVSRVMFIHYMRDTGTLGTLLSTKEYRAVINKIVNIQ